jgi:hypothetical protein
VAVVDVSLFKVLLPFHDAPGGVHAGWREPEARRVKAPGEVLVDPEDSRRDGGIREHVAGDLLVNRGPGAERSCLPRAAAIGVHILVLG